MLLPNAPKSRSDTGAAKQAMHAAIRAYCDTLPTITAQQLACEDIREDVECLWLDTETHMLYTIAWTEQDGETVDLWTWNSDGNDLRIGAVPTDATIHVAL